MSQTDKSAVKMINEATGIIKTLSFLSLNLLEDGSRSFL